VVIDIAALAVFTLVFTVWDDVFVQENDAEKDVKITFSTR
jgi:hypothetical protein